MSSFLSRWDDESRPSFTDALKDLGMRAVPPAIVLFGAIVGFGYLLKGPLQPFGEWENGINRYFQDGRTPTGETVTKFMSMIGNTEYVIGVAVIVAALIWWRTKRWWYAVVPLIAISLQATVFVIATHVVGRARPPVERLDPTPPTSSYPSGHVGASTALYITFALMAARIENAWLRRVLVTLTVIAPLLVSYARIYRGAHHLSDVIWGIINGLVCAVIAWLYLRRDPSKGSSSASRAASRTAA
ncbi:phosphatase PAP2 family protein [Oryzobacter telluris]|uniref:phosphatase PAP2 family protein n=1 Tax=Oryzobacter telluris TaxID=3149179 RepID=UPI00370DE09C